MVRPSADDVAGLVRVASEIRGTTDAFGYSVDVAVGQHEAFSRSRGPASTLERSLVLDAARRGASQAGFQTEEVSGSLDVVTMSENTIRRYRLKRVKVTAEGEYGAVCGAGSSLLMAEPESLYRQEKWVLGFVTSDEHTIDRLIAAEITGWTGSGPVRLKFGTIIDLFEDPSLRGFVSTDEGLEDFEEEDGGADSADAG